MKFTRQQFHAMDLRPSKKLSKEVVERGIQIINERKQLFKQNIKNKEFMKVYEVDI